MKGLQKLTKWYESNCDGDWEHIFGIKIETSDNPGWIIKIDIIETDAEGYTMDKASFIEEEDWYFIKCDGKIFKANGDPKKLGFLIDQFLKLVERKL